MWWCGIFDYEKKHEGLILELSNLIGPLWEYFLPINFTGIDLKDSLSVFEKMIPNFPDATKILSQFSNQQEIFCHLERWLKSRGFGFKPTNHREWYVLSKFLSLVSWVSVKDIDILVLLIARPLSLRVWMSVLGFFLDLNVQGVQTLYQIMRDSLLNV